VSGREDLRQKTKTPIKEKELERLQKSRNIKKNKVKGPRTERKSITAQES